MIFSIPELIVLAGIVFLMGIECWLALKSRSWIEVYRPTLFVAVVLAFYALVGPLRAIFSAGEPVNFIGTSGTIYRNLDHRPFLFWGWLGAFAFYASLLAGFHMFNYRLKLRSRVAKINLNKIKFFGQMLCGLGIFSYAFVSGGYFISRLNPFAPGNFNNPFLGWTGVNVGPFDNYFYLAVNFLIPGIIIQFAVWLRQRTKLWIVLAWISAAVLIFLSEAFRYRLLLLVFPLLLLWFFYCKKRPMLIMLLVSMTFFVSISGAITIARGTMRGLDVNALATRTPLELVVASFEETGAFFTTSAVIEAVPTKLPYVKLEPLFTALMQPLPRSLFSIKPTGAYSREIPDIIYNQNRWRSHAVFLGYGEYYIMYGWSSLIVVSFALGAALKYLWAWFLCRQYEPLAQCIYLLNSSYLYVVISRGYLSQVVMLYVFTVLPSAIVYFLVSRFEVNGPSIFSGKNNNSSGI